jgi:hypothetical protein
VCDGWEWQRDDASIAVLGGNRVYGAACIVLFGLCFFYQPDGCVMLCHSFLSILLMLALSYGYAGCEKPLETGTWVEYCIPELPFAVD